LLKYDEIFELKCVCCTVSLGFHKKIHAIDADTNNIMQFTGKLGAINLDILVDASSYITDALISSHRNNIGHTVTFALVNIPLSILARARMVYMWHTKRWRMNTHKTLTFICILPVCSPLHFSSAHNLPRVQECCGQEHQCMDEANASSSQGEQAPQAGRHSQRSRPTLFGFQSFPEAPLKARVPFKIFLDGKSRGIVGASD